jgi:hypothetical protein
MKMLEEMAEIRVNSIQGRYDEAIAAIKDTSAMVTPQVAVAESAEPVEGR